ncbi:MAG TPA: tail fiber domain-containing protein [Cyclobacteriaceae bacterium]|nr:tail fiber domain-containing protein [Cyclobacteriaceae bacterium]
MKKLLIFFAAVFFTTTIYAQPPEKMSYQAVIRNSNNELVTNHAVGMQVIILQGSETGTAVYSETQTPTTNANGLITVEIGNGTVVSGSFSGIDWSAGPYFLKTETDPDGGTNYTITGTSQLLSVPYAFHAATTDNAFSGNYEDLANKPVLADIAITGEFEDLLNAPGLFDGTWNSLSGKPTLATVATSGSYNDLLNKPSAFDGTWSSLSGKPDFATVATSGSYNDLSDKPSGFDGTWSSITGKPDFATVATSASYNDLLNRPTLFSGSWNNLTNNPFSFVTPADNQLVKYNNTAGKWENWTPDFLNAETDPVWSAALGSYYTMTNLQTDGQAQVHWNNLMSAPIFHAIATSGDYNDLTNKPINLDNTLYNTSLGFEALNPATTGEFNAAMGYQALYSNTSGQYNTANGYLALYLNAGGADNTAYGGNTLSLNTSGSGNTAIGSRALLRNTTGGGNTAVGYRSLRDNTGGYNTAVGWQSLYANMGGQYNTAIGHNALVGNEASSSNTAIGVGTLSSNYGDGRNTCVGNWSLSQNALGADNTAIGFQAFYSNSSSYSNSTAIGANSQIFASGQMMFGDENVTNWSFGEPVYDATRAIQVGTSTGNGNGAYLTVGGVWTNGSDKNKKENIAHVYGKDILAKINILPITRWNYIGEPASVTHIGPMAQDFFELFRTGDDDRYISTIDPSGVALAGIQALIDEITALKETLDRLEAENAKLRLDYGKRIEKIEALLYSTATYK